MTTARLSVNGDDNEIVEYERSLDSWLISEDDS